MFEANTITLYVNDLAVSKAFYQRLLGRDPIAFSPDFVMFFQESGARLALWSRANVEPEPPPPGGCELSFYASGREEVDAVQARWEALGITIVKKPWSTAFVYSFLAVDPDGHRLRVYWPLASGG